MAGRYMTSDIEEMAAFGAAMLTAAECEELLGKILPVGPSATAIQKVVCRIGTELDERREEVEEAVWKDKPLSPKGDALVVSWDGVMTPMRGGPVAWREAGVATISVYRDEPEAPEKIDTRYLARMPEAGMTSLVARITDQVARAVDAHEYREIAVICDGKSSIWNTAAEQAVLSEATFILDFYHASENLMNAAKAIFGDTDEAAAWHTRHREKMLIEQNGAANARRSMLRYARSLTPGSAGHRIVENCAAYFHRHRDRMRYAEFIERGLPVGSGPVEAAAKSIVQARLKRSGMHWTPSGGQHVLDLRTYLKSERWESMWNTLQAAA